MCDCIKVLNEKLGPEHMVNASMALLPGTVERPVIDLIRKDKWVRETRRSKPSFIQAEYCPWCGEKYPAPKDVEEETEP